MRLTKRQLKRIIREEKRRLQESGDIYPRPQHPMIANANSAVVGEVLGEISMVLEQFLSPEEADEASEAVIDALMKLGILK